VSKPLVFQHGAAATAFTAVVACWAVFELAMRVRQQRLAYGRTGRDPTILVVWAGIAGSVVAAEVLGRSGVLPWPGGPVWPVVTGLTAMAAGIGLRAWSIISLGRFFQYQLTIQSGHRVVTSGPYRYVRHPSYAGIALVLIGIALATGDVLSMVAVLVLGGTGLWVRIHVEERQLAGALGAEYEQFAATHKRLVPGVW
jgi:protein-S-isoprenylcysteine O-methyltransferase Ste14